MDYPVYRKYKHNNIHFVVEYTSENEGVVIESDGRLFKLGHKSSTWVNHKDEYIWVNVDDLYKKPKVFLEDSLFEVD